MCKCCTTSAPAVVSRAHDICTCMYECVCIYIYTYGPGGHEERTPPERNGPASFGRAPLWGINVREFLELMSGGIFVRECLELMSEQKCRASAGLSAGQNVQKLMVFHFSKSAGQSAGRTLIPKVPGHYSGQTLIPNPPGH